MDSTDSRTFPLSQKILSDSAILTTLLALPNVTTNVRVEDLWVVCGVMPISIVPNFCPDNIPHEPYLT